MMTRHTFLTALLVVGAAASVLPAAPGGIDLIEQVHTVWGSAGYPVTDAYFASEAESTTGSALGIGPDDRLCTATSTAGPGALSAYRSGSAGFANAYARSAYRFTSNGDHLVLDVSGRIGEWAFENVARLQLTDVTAGAVVYAYESPGFDLSWLPGDERYYGYAFSFQEDLLVNPAHVYELVGAAEAHRGEPGSGSATLSIEFFAIPAPVPLTLGALGTACAAWLRRRRML